MRLVPTPVLSVVVGDVVTFDGTTPGLTVVKVGRGLKIRNLTVQRADGEVFTFAEQATSTVDVVVLDPEDHPTGADVLVSTATGGYRGRVQPRDRFGRVWVQNGRSRWILRRADRVQVLALDGSQAAAEARDEPLPSAWFDRAGSTSSRSSEPPSDPSDSGWATREVNEATGDPVWTASAPDLPFALGLWRKTLEERPLAWVQVLLNGTVYADVTEHDTCTVHTDAVFSKDVACPLCVTDEEQRWHDDPAGAEKDAAHRTRTVLHALLNRTHGTDILTPAERSALDSALFVLED